jgi:hypothetical protein
MILPACHHSLLSGAVLILTGLHKRLLRGDFKSHFEQKYLEPALAEGFLFLSFSFLLHSFCAIYILFKNFLKRFLLPSDKGKTISGLEIPP